MSIHELIAGALYDFMGRLTAVDAPITLSRHHTPDRLLDVFKEWATDRGRNTEEADVQGWRFHLQDETPPVAVEETVPSGGCVRPQGHEYQFLPRDPDPPSHASIHADAICLHCSNQTSFRIEI